MKNEISNFDSLLNFRWDINAMEKLPEYMKVLYEIIFNFYEEIKQDINNDNMPYAIHYAKEGVRSDFFFLNTCRRGDSNSQTFLPFSILFLIYGVKFWSQMKRQCRVYFAEAKWFHGGHLPTMEQYMKVAIVSTCYYLFAPTCFLGMEVEASKEAFQWVESDPLLLKATGVIGRLMNDITSRKVHKFSFSFFEFNNI